MNLLELLRFRYCQRRRTSRIKGGRRGLILLEYKYRERTWRSHGFSPVGFFRGTSFRRLRHTT